jgi:outer membrane protein OmpA-like peptidoglycan-associated protein
MKSRHSLLLALPLVASMAFAQQDPTPSSTDLSSQPQQTQPSTQPAGADTTIDHQPLQIQSHEGFWGHLNPFARKKYVRRQLTPVIGRVNELDELTAQNTKMIKDVDSRATEGIRLASLKANEADSHAVEAGNRAQLAHQTATQASQRLQTVEKVVGNIDQYQRITDAEIRFRPGQSVLSSKAKAALDEIAVPLKDQKGYVVEVQGFAAGRGQAAIAQSQRMAESVVRYLVVNHNIPVYRIYTLGMGNAPVQDENGNAKRVRGGRVEVSLLRNGVSELEQAQNSMAPSVAPASDNGQSNGGVTGQSNVQSNVGVQSDQTSTQFNGSTSSTTVQQQNSIQPKPVQPNTVPNSTPNSTDQNAPPKL